MNLWGHLIGHAAASKGSTTCYNKLRAHQGKHCEGKTPMETFRENLPLAKEKLVYFNNK
jgi:hypothetical protein